MALEICNLCGSEATPWYCIKSLQGHVCQNCYHEYQDIDKAICNKIFLNKLLKFVKDKALSHYSTKQLENFINNHNCSGEEWENIHENLPWYAEDIAKQILSARALLKELEKI